MTHRSDDALRNAFEELRTQDGHQAPAFARTLTSRKTVRAQPRAIVGVMSVVTLAAMVVVAAVVARTNDAHAPGVPITAWKPASDALLEIARPAGFEILQSRGTSALDALVSPHTLSGVRQ